MLLVVGFIVMLGCVMACVMSQMSCDVTQCHVMSCDACHVMSCDVTMLCVMSCNIMLCDVCGSMHLHVIDVF